MKKRTVKTMLSIGLAAALLTGLTGCKKAQTEPVEEDGNSYSAGYDMGMQDGEKSGYEKGYEAGLAEGKKAAEAENTQTAAEEKMPFYDSSYLNVYLVEMLEDSVSYHVMMKAQNKTDRELHVEFPALAFNGMTADGSGSVSIPAKGDAYVTMSYSKEAFRQLGIEEVPADIRICAAVYDSENYTYMEGKTVQVVLTEGNTAPVQTAVKEQLYNENGITISSLGISVNEYGENCLKISVENSTEEMIMLGGAAASAPGENLEISAYCNCLPGTKAVTQVYLYTAEFGTSVDPQQLPFANIAFRMEKSDGSGSVLTDPLKVMLGKEGRYELSADKKTLTVKMSAVSMEDSEWTATVSEDDVLVIESMNVEADTPELYQEEMTVVYKAGRPGSSSLLIQYHPAGISLIETDEYWPNIYSQRELQFRVSEEGCFEPDAVFMELTDYSEEELTWYYILRNDGTIYSKDTAAG